MATKKVPAWIERATVHSSRAWNDAKYAQKGMGRLNLRLPNETLSKLEELAAHTQLGKAVIVEQLIDAEHARVFEGVDPEDPQKMNLHPKKEK